jgi:lipoprotein-anchoring transpeptidase ErfK/SrfK
MLSAPAVLAALVLLAGCSGGRPAGAAAPVVALSIAPAGNTPINPTTPITVTASNGRLTAVTVTGRQGTKVAGSFTPDRTRWSSTAPLGYGKTYQVAARATGTGDATASTSRTVRVLTPAALAYPSLIPPPNFTDVGVGQPVVVRFDRAIKDKMTAQRALAVTVSPAQVGAWYWISDREVHYRSKTYWKPGTTVRLKVRVYGVDLGGGTYGETDRALTFHVHDSWLAKADGAAESMRIYHSGALVKTMPISLGSPGYPSHSGPHVISFKAPTYVMDSSTYGVGPGQPGYYRETVYLDERISGDGEFVHSAPWSVGSQGSSNVSHGCVNLSPANASWFFDHFGVGDVVEITNSGGPKLPLWDTYGDWVVPWSVWSKGNASS